MHKAKRIFKRVFFCFMSVVLVCCMLFNMATPKAQALMIVDDLAIGITALLLLAAAGVVFAPKVSEDIVAIGQSFKTSMYQWGTSAEKLDEVEEWFTDLSLYSPGDPGDEGDEDPRYQVRLARGILSGIAGWIASVCLAGEIEAEGDVAPDGSTFYNGVLLPTFTNESSPVYLVITGPNSMGRYYAYTSTSLISLKEGNNLYFSSQGKAYSYHPNNGNYWSGDGTVYGGKTVSFAGSLFWANKPIYFPDGKYYSFPSSTSVLTETFTPTIFIGDLPDQIQSGEKDADDIILPGVIDYGSLIQDGMTLEESVIDTMTQLSDGNLSHEEFLNKTMVAEFPSFIKNLPTLPGMGYTYQVGDKADTFTVEASGNADGSGVVTYEWLDTSTVPYTVLGTGPSYTPDTSKPGTIHLACRAINTVPCSFVEGGYLIADAYSWTYHITVEDTVVDPPGSDTETDEDEKLGIISGTLDRIESLLNPDTDTLTDSSQALQGSMNELGAFEQSQLDGLQNNKHVITDAFKIFGEGSTLLSAFNLVTYIVNGTYNSLGAYQVVITLPVVLGIFLFICSRVRGFDRPRKNNPGSRSSQAKVSAAAGGNDPKSPEV